MTGQLGWTGDNGDPDNFFFLLGCNAARDGGGRTSRASATRPIEDKLQESAPIDRQGGAGEAL